MGEHRGCVIDNIGSTSYADDGHGGYINQSVELRMKILGLPQ